MADPKPAQHALDQVRKAAGAAAAVRQASQEAAEQAYGDRPAPAPAPGVRR
jgi:hypothetical protein